MTYPNSKDTNPQGNRDLFDVIGFGALNLDLIYRVPTIGFLIKEYKDISQVSEISAKEEKFQDILSLLKKKGELKAQSGGGQAANTIVSLSRLGFKTGYMGKVGTDEEGEYLLETLESVDKSRVVRENKSGICLSVLGPELDRTNIISPNANDTLTYDEIDVEYLENTRFLHMTSFVGKKPFEAQKRIADELAGKVKITFDPNEIYAVRPLKELVPIIEKSTVLFLTDREVRFLTGKDEDEGSQVLLDYGPEILVCKRGHRGSKIYSHTRKIEFEMPAKRVKVVDKTGAGDVYAAGFIAGILLDYSLRECATLATEMAAISITGYGRENYVGREILKKYPKPDKHYV
jgi:ribokinase